MARLSMKCECGWSFFIPDTTQGWEVSCPRCQQSVPIPGRKPGEGAPVSAGELAARLQDRQRTKVLAVAGGAALVVLALAAYFLFGGSPPPPEDEMPNSALSGARRAAPSADPRPPAPRPPPPPPVDPELDERRRAAAVAASIAPEQRRIVAQSLWLCNLGGIASEVLRLRGHDALHQDVLKRVAGWDAAMSDAAKKLNDAGEKTTLDPHFLPGDRVVAFGQRDLRAMKSADASEVMARWLSEFQPGRPMEMMTVLRGEQRIDLYVHLPEATPELASLAKEAPAAGYGTAGPPSPTLFTSSFVAGPAVAPVPKASLEDVAARFAALPPGYAGALPAAERSRLDALLKQREGTGEDLVFIEIRIRTEALPAFEKEAALFKQRKSDLEAKVKEPAAVDVVHFKDGRKLEGQIVKETETHVTLKQRLGAVPFPKEDIDRVVKGAGAGAKFPEELKKSGGAMPGLAGLLDWCLSNKLRTESEYVAYWILTLEPLHEPARRSLGLRAPATK